MFVLSKPVTRATLTYTFQVGSVRSETPATGGSASEANVASARCGTMLKSVGGLANAGFCRGSINARAVQLVVKRHVTTSHS